MKRLLPTLPLLALTVIASARADDLTRLPLEDLLQVEVEGASRYAQPIAEAPSTASVISAEDIHRYGYTQLSDALRMARGVYSTYDRTYTYLGLRGFGRPGDYNSRLLLLVDGARSNDTVYDQAMVGNEAPIDLDWVKRIEFVPGPASALYGGNALFGVANAVLWSGADLNGSRISAQTGSHGETGVSLLGGRQIDDGADWVAGVSVWRRSGANLHFDEFDVPGTSDGIAHGLDGEKYLKAFAKFSSHGWRLTASYSNRYKDVPTAYYGTLFDTPGTYTRDQHLHLDLTQSSALSAQWSQFARLHLGAYSFKADYVLPTELNRDEALSTWWSGEYRLTYTGLADHKLLFGGEVRHSPHMDQRNFDLAPRTQYLDDHRTGSSYGVYVQDEWRLSSRWLANLGARLDHAEGSGTIGSPRLALIYHPLPQATAKLLYGRAFRAPNAYERYYNDSGGTVPTSKPNPGLKPERIDSREISLDYALTPATRIGVSHYRYTLHNLIDQTTDTADGLLVFTNREDMQARGWELEAEAIAGAGWRLRGSLAWQHIEQSDGEPVNSPRRLAKLFFDGPIADNWTAGIELQAMSRRRTLAGSTGGNAVAQLALRQARPGPYGQWSLVLRNLLDQRYGDPGTPGHVQDILPQNGRQWLLRWEAPL